MKAVILPLLAALAATAPAVAQNHAHHAPAEASAAVEGRGVVKSVDAAAGTVTLAHEAIPALGWPPMTMSFKAASAPGLAALKPEDKVKFRLKGGQIVAIERL